MKEKVQAPELRFDGFTDDWELRKLTNITSSYSGLTYSPTDIQDTGTFVLRSSNVKNDQLIDADNVYVNPDIVNSINVKVGDVIIVVRNGSRALIGKHAIVNEEMPDTVIGAFMSAFRGENGNYINALLSTDNFQKEVHKSLGATINQITGKDFSMMIFPTPKFGEQQKIGAFFKQLDYTIALHQRKLDLLKEQKKGYLQKMFPKNGAKVPELRFAGFVDDWEERKLGDISYKVKEKNKTGEFTETLTNSAEYGIINQRDFFDKDISNAKNLTGYYVVKNDDFVYNPRISNFAPVGPIKRNKLGRTGVMSPLYYVFRTHDIDKNYFEKYFDTVYWHRFMELNGDSGARADRFAIKDSVFVEMPIPYPTMDEQQKIGSFFQQLDNTITLHQLKLDLLKEQKKGFLQKMFA